MIIKSPKALCNDYRKVELNILTELLHREQNRIAGVRTFSMDDMYAIAKELLNDR